MTAPIKRGELTSRTPLEFIIPDGARKWSREGPGPMFNPAAIPKTLVFIDNRDDCNDITTQLIRLFPEWTRSPQLHLAQDIVCEYHTGISSPKKDVTLREFRRGYCRILVCTDAVGMGVDIPDIARVIQWRIPSWLSPSSLWQRIGRAARNPTLSGQAVAFYEPALDVPAVEVTDGTTNAVLRASFAQQENRQRALDFIHEAIETPQGLVNLDEDDDTQLDRIRDGTESSQKARKCQKNDRYMLWFLNTEGCLRDVMLSYLDGSPEPRNPTAIGTHPCCDRCMQDADIPADSWQGAPVADTTPYVRAQSPQFKKPRYTTKIDDRIRVALKYALQILRIRLFRERRRLPGKHTTFRPRHIIPDEVIDQLSKRYDDIHDAGSLEAALKSPGALKHMFTQSHIETILDTVQDIVAKATPLKPKRAIKNTEIGPPEPHPVYSTHEMEVELNQEVKELMRSSNKAVCEYDEMQVAKREAARKSRHAKMSSQRMFEELLSSQIRAESVISDAGSAVPLVTGSDIEGMLGLAAAPEPRDAVERGQAIEGWLGSAGSKRRRISARAADSESAEAVNEPARAPPHKPSKPAALKKQTVKDTTKMQLAQQARRAREKKAKELAQLESSQQVNSTPDGPL
jgi:superfamily II DNA helicase RecQ